MSSRVERTRVAAAQIPELSARIIARALNDAIRAHAEASFCLSGGTTPRATYEALSQLSGIEWPKVTIYFGDERCVEPDHPDSNYRMAREALLDRVAVRPEHVHRIRAENQDRAAAARSYDLTLPAAFDVLLLGIGEDGHTASLFPGSDALRETHRRVLPVIGPKPPPERLTLTPPPLRSARLTLVLASGASKAEAVARALEGPEDVSRCPAQIVRDAVWIMDHAAGSLLSGSFPERAAPT